MSFKLTILGAGSSAGTPVVGCNCKTCLSTNPKNKRTRCSSIIQLSNGNNILIDTPINSFRLNTSGAKVLMFGNQAGNSKLFNTSDMWDGGDFIVTANIVDNVDGEAGLFEAPAIKAAVPRVLITFRLLLLTKLLDLFLFFINDPLFI